jgi:hypothetical protein
VKWSIFRVEFPRRVTPVTIPWISGAEYQYPSLGLARVASSAQDLAGLLIDTVPHIGMSIIRLVLLISNMPVLEFHPVTVSINIDCEINLFLRSPFLVPGLTSRSNSRIDPSNLRRSRMTRASPFSHPSTWTLCWQKQRILS